MHSQKRAVQEHEDAEAKEGKVNNDDDDDFDTHPPSSSPYGASPTSRHLEKRTRVEGDEIGRSPMPGSEDQPSPTTSSIPLTTACPLCGDHFPLKDIEAHAAGCSIPQMDLEEGEEGEEEGTGRGNSMTKCPFCEQLIPSSEYKKHLQEEVEAFQGESSSSGVGEIDEKEGPIPPFSPMQVQESGSMDVNRIIQIDDSDEERAGLGGRKGGDQRRRLRDTPGPRDEPGMEELLSMVEALDEEDEEEFQMVRRQSQRKGSIMVVRDDDEEVGRGRRPPPSSGREENMGDRGRRHGSLSPLRGFISLEQLRTLDPHVHQRYMAQMDFAPSDTTPMDYSTTEGDGGTQTPSNVRGKGSKRGKRSGGGGGSRPKRGRKRS
ncbi:MAG: hypothetical protein DHS80DRAFT_22416 [Piptocephalis tieghemiana]|nr:MAG: hypothetical protein DHS80DRAFT_22416 [Piptocephalis tieghemiana]